MKIPIAKKVNQKPYYTNCPFHGKTFARKIQETADSSYLSCEECAEEKWRVKLINEGIIGNYRLAKNITKIL